MFLTAILYYLCCSLVSPFDATGAPWCYRELQTTEWGVCSWLDISLRLCDQQLMSIASSCWIKIRARFLAGVKRDTEESSANPKGKEGAQHLLSNLSLLTDLSARPWCKLSEHLALLQASAKEQFSLPAHTWGASLLWQESCSWRQSLQISALEWAKSHSRVSWLCSKKTGFFLGLVGYSLRLFLSS